MVSLKDILVQAKENYPNRTAVITPEKEQINYSKLFDKITSLSQLLSDHNIKASDRIGIYLPKSCDKVVAVLATLHTDAVYVPVDDTAPVSRNAYIFTDCQVAAIFILDNLIDSYKSTFKGVIDTIDIPGLPQLKLLLCTYDSPVVESFPSDLAYLLYTSGSTGNPKGVMITHRNALSFIQWCAETFTFADHEIFSSIAPFHFDLSIFDLYVSLLHGGTLILFDQKTAKNPLLISSLISEYKISVMYSTPSVLKLILQYGKIDRYDHSSLNLVLFAGEVFHIEPLKGLKSAWNQVTFYNLYGPTETNVVTYFRLPEIIPLDQNTPFPIGTSCNHVECRIWEESFKPIEKGQRGELVVKGASVMPGYFKQKEKTAAAFLEDKNGQKWYRTGDIVELDDRLDYIFIGRRDRMVKRRGYRIELGEIEQILNSHPALLEAAVIANGLESGETQINAFVVLNSTSQPIKTFQLKQYCMTHLLRYMLPDHFHFLEAIPKTSTHKVDYQSLQMKTHH